MESKTGINDPLYKLHDYSETGFLPREAPVTALPPHLSYLDQIAAELPALNRDGYLRRVVADLPIVSSQGVYLSYTERLYVIYCFLGAAYLHGGDDQEPTTFLPLNLAKPLADLSAELRLPPFLCYESAVLLNWRRDIAKSWEMGNVNLIMRISVAEVESWMLRYHVCLEYAGRQAIRSIHTLRKMMNMSAQNSIAATAEAEFSLFRKAIIAMTDITEEARKKINPQHYNTNVAPYFCGHGDVSYTGCYDGRQIRSVYSPWMLSPIIPAIGLMLGIRIYPARLRNMLSYMGTGHRTFLQHLNASVTPYDTQVFGYASMFDLRRWITNSIVGNKRHAERYNNCVEEFFTLLRARKSLFQGLNVNTQPSPTEGLTKDEWLDYNLDQTDFWL